MSDLHDDLALDSSPRVPGGGPASRWRTARITSRFFWIWLGLTLTCLAVLGAVIAAWVREGISDTGIGIFVGLVILLPVLLAGAGGAVSFAVESRVDDDMTTYAWGTAVTLRTGRGLGVEAGVEIRGDTVARLLAADDGGRRGLVVGKEELTLVRRGPRIALRDAGGPVGEALTYESGTRSDHEITVDGRVLRLRRRTGSSVPRATLLDDRGRAWAVTYGRDHLTVRLPDEVHEGGAAFCLVVLAHLDGRIGPIAGEAAPARSGRRRRRARTRA